MIKKLLFYNILFISLLYSNNGIPKNIHNKVIHLSNTNNFTKELQKLISLNDEVFIKKGEYYLDLNKIIIPNNKKIYGEGEKTKIYVKNNSKFNSKVKPSSIFSSINPKNIEISKLSFFSTGNNSYVLKAYSSKRNNFPSIKINNTNTDGMGLIWIGPKKGFTYNRPTKKENTNWYNNGPVKKSQIMDNILINNNIIKGDTKYKVGTFKKPSASAITLLYANNAKITNNVISNFRFGIWAYGGATRTNNKKKLTYNNIMCSNIEITNNEAYETYSPYWASKCSNVLIKDNYSLNNQDVAVDFEGSINSIAQNNIIINSSGGALVALNSSKNIVFLNNIVVTKRMNRNTNIVLIRDGNRNIVYKDNLFFYEQNHPFDYARILLKNSSKLIDKNKKVSFIKNEFYNTIIESKENITIDNNNNIFNNKNLLKSNISIKTNFKDKND